MRKRTFPIAILTTLSLLQANMPQSTYSCLLSSIVYTSVIFMFPRRNLLPAFRHHVKGRKAKALGSLSLCNNMINLPTKIGYLI